MPPFANNLTPSELDALAICYDLAKRLNGQITVESQVGDGATFTVWLPIALPLPG